MNSIPLFKIYWDNDDIEQVESVIKRGMSWTIGPSVSKFEADLKSYLGTKYCVVFNSGTSALHAILKAYDMGPGDEVIVPSFTFIATANASLFVGATPVFADIEERTLGLDPADVERKITPKTKAIIPVHFGGSPCLITELKQVADRHGLLLIEDAAEGLGAKVGEKFIATFGQAGVLSFCQNKIITTGEGGAIVTDSHEIYEKLLLIRSHGRQESANYFTSNAYMDYVTLGYNFRLSDISAALGSAQLSKIDKIIDLRTQNANYLSRGLENENKLIIPRQLDGHKHVFQMYCIRVKGGAESRDRLMSYLSSVGIFSKVYFSPVHLTSFYRQILRNTIINLPVTERVSNETLALPMYPTLTNLEMDYIVEHVRLFNRGGT